jgi:hypothetical protein
MSNVADLTLAELEALPTPRLLNVLKKVRRAAVYASGDDGCYANEVELALIKKAEDQYALVRSVCNTREHIKRTGKPEVS